MLPHKLRMGTGAALPLSADDYVATGLQRLRGVFDGLAERTAAMGALGERAHVEMGVDVDDTALNPGTRVTQVMSERCLVPTAQDNGYCSTETEHHRQPVTQSFLGRFQVGIDSDVTEVKDVQCGQVRAGQRVPGREAVQVLPDGVRRLCRAGAAVVTAHALITWETDQDRAAEREHAGRTVPAPDHFAQTRVFAVAAAMEQLRRCRLKRRPPRGRT